MGSRDSVTQYRMMTLKLLVILAVCESKVSKEKTFARTSEVKTALGNLPIFVFLGEEISAEISAAPRNAFSQRYSRGIIRPHSKGICSRAKARYRRMRPRTVIRQTTQIQRL